MVRRDVGVDVGFDVGLDDEGGGGGSVGPVWPSGDLRAFGFLVGGAELGGAELATAETRNRG